MPIFRKCEQALVTRVSASAQLIKCECSLCVSVVAHRANNGCSVTRTVRTNHFLAIEARVFLVFARNCGKFTIAKTRFPCGNSLQRVRICWRANASVTTTYGTSSGSSTTIPVPKPKKLLAPGCVRSTSRTLWCAPTRSQQPKFFHFPRGTN